MDSIYQQRRDVVNKTILRKMRKYYLTEIRKESKGMIVYRKSENIELITMTKVMAGRVMEWAKGKVEV